ncbi:MAG: hypothetical protein ABI216_21365, partial [Devosia sp.]
RSAESLLTIPRVAQISVRASRARNPPGTLRRNTDARPLSRKYEPTPIGALQQYRRAILRSARTFPSDSAPLRSDRQAPVANLVAKSVVKPTI